MLIHFINYQIHRETKTFSYLHNLEHC